MRWEQLFADLDAEFEDQERRELLAEVADRTRREGALVGLGDRLRAGHGAALVVRCLGGHQVTARLLDSGADWLLLEETGRRQVLVPLASVVTVTGLGSATAPPGSQGVVARRLDLRWALRGLARSRTGVRLLLGDGNALAGTLDRVGMDHIELAEHPDGELRRVRAVRQVVAVPLAALSAVVGDTT